MNSKVVTSTKHQKLRWGAVKSLDRPTSQCHTMESIVSLERGVCSCAELQVFSCYRGWKEACQATRAISTTSRRELSSRFFFLQGKVLKEIQAFWQKHQGNMHDHITPSESGWPSLNVVIFPPVMRLILDDPKQWQPRRLVMKFTS